MSKTLPKFEDYKAPWEVDSDGNEIPEDQQNLDPALLKKKLYKALEDRHRVVTERDGLQTELTQAKADLATERKKTEGEDEKAKREAQEALDAAKREGGLAALKLEVALDIEGITPAQAKRLAKRLSGSTQEELEADAKAIAEDFGLGKAAPQGEDDGDDDGDEPPVVPGRPRTPRAVGDPTPNDAKLPAADGVTVNKLFPRR